MARRELRPREADRLRRRRRSSAVRKTELSPDQNPVNELNKTKDKRRRTNEQTNKRRELLSNLNSFNLRPKLHLNQNPLNCQ